VFQSFEQYLKENFEGVVGKDGVQKLEEKESEQAELLGVEGFKMKTNEEMLTAINK
jgi:hypothetical protein